MTPTAHAATAHHHDYLTDSAGGDAYAEVVDVYGAREPEEMTFASAQGLHDPVEDDSRTVLTILLPDHGPEETADRILSLRA